MNNHSLIKLVVYVLDYNAMYTPHKLIVYTFDQRGIVLIEYIEQDDLWPTAMCDVYTHIYIIYSQIPLQATTLK